MRDRSMTVLFERYQRKGDGRALAAVFDGCAKPLLELACHLVRDSAEAEDLVQATFLAAIHQAQRYDGSTPLEGWLYGILWREAARARRRAARRVDPARLDARAEADPLELAAAGEVPDAVARALARLPQRYREVLQPLLFEQKRPEHIARELARSAGTVRSQIHRGLEELRRALAPRFAAYGALALPTRGLSEVRAAVLQAAGFAPATVATAPLATLGLVAGGMLVSKSVLVGVATVALVVSATWVALERSSAAARGAGMSSSAVASVTDAPAPAAPAPEPPVRPASDSGARAERAAEPPRARDLEASVAHWLARFAEAPEDWRHGWNVAEEIAELPPDEALAVMRAVWPHLTVPVKEQVLKPFVFHGGRANVLPVLHLGATDAAPSVQGRAFGYLRDYAFRDFALDYEAYLAWAARNLERPLADVLRESARAFAAELLALSPSELAQRMRELDALDFRCGDAVGIDLAAEIRAAGGERALETALADPDPEVVRQALEWSMALRVDERWLRTWVLPLTDASRPELASAAFGALARPDCGWASETLLACLARATDVRGSATREAAGALAEIGDPAAIPELIALLLRDRTGALAYDVGYFGLAKLTGVKWQEGYDGAWWAAWWEKNRARFPPEVAARDVR